MHAFADGIISLKRKAQIADTADDVCKRQILLDIAAGFNIILRIIRVLRHAGSNRQNIRVKKDVLGRKIQLVTQQTIHSRANIPLPFKGRRLAIFVERHTDHGKAAPPNLLCSI